MKVLPVVVSSLIVSATVFADVVEEIEYISRSDERRVGKECRSPGSPDH